jgi:hypothetical protein
MNVRLRTAGFALMPVAVAAVLLMHGPIAQFADYHRFADSRAMAGLANFADTISNVPFLLIGLAGILHWLRSEGEERSLAWLAVFAGAVFVCFGSWHYHQNPNDETLVWDRLPIAFTFMAFFVAVLEDHLGRRTASALLLPALISGAAGVFYWKETGDLRPYLWTQIVPLLAVPLALGVFRARYTHRRWYWAVFACYALAKVAEVLDFQIFRMTGTLVSGHTLKHLVAAAGLVFLLWMLLQRRPLASAPPIVTAAVAAP